MTPPKPAVATSTTLSTLLKSGAKPAASATITASTGSAKSQPPSSSSTNNNQEDIPELFKDKSAAALFQNDNFVIKLPPPTNAPMRVMISDYDEFDDDRLTAKDIRKLLFSKPAVAELLYEAMLDVALVDEEIPVIEDPHAVQEQKGNRSHDGSGEEDDEGSEEEGSRGDGEKSEAEGPVTFRPSFLFNQPITVNMNADMSDDDNLYPRSDDEDGDGDGDEDEDEDGLLERVGHGLHLHDLRDD